VLPREGFSSTFCSDAVVDDDDVDNKNNSSMNFSFYLVDFLLCVSTLKIAVHVHISIPTDRRMPRGIYGAALATRRGYKST